MKKKTNKLDIFVYEIDYNKSMNEDSELDIFELMDEILHLNEEERDRRLLTFNEEERKKIYKFIEGGIL